MHYTTLKRKNALRWRHIAALLIVGLMLAAGALSLASGGAQVAHAADTPNIEIDEIPDVVTPDETLKYKFIIQNWTDMEIVHAEFKLPYNTDILTPIGSELYGEDDWVKEASDGDVVVIFGPVEDDEERSAVIEFAINPNTPDSTALRVEAEYTWHSQNRRGSGDVDLETIVLNPNVQPQASITPAAGPPGTIFTIRANRFEPYETVVTWLNTPTGVQELDLYGQAGNPGTIELTFDSSGLAPGDYSLVLHGTDSGHERVLPFSLR